jgi:hypothetical protein
MKLQGMRSYKNAPASFFEVKRDGTCGRRRANKAARAIEAHWEETKPEGASAKDLFHDLLADLWHWCEGQGLDFYEIAAEARATFKQERDQK